MKIAIHHSSESYSKHWISYCEENNIPYKIVNCYQTNIISQLNDCDALMWHHNHANPKDKLFAKELLYSLETVGKIVYPDSKTTWHFDDKLGQKYLLEATNLPLIPTNVFYSKKEALEWISQTEFPLVFKLRSGARSRNVRLINNEREAKKIIRKAFNRGIRQYNPFEGIKESVRKYLLNKTTLVEVIKAFAHFVYPIQLEKSMGREKGYVYFQKFIPGCKYDIRVQLVKDRGYAMIRNVRKNDFRASGGGNINYDGSIVPINAIKLALDATRKLEMQTMAIDLIPFEESFLIAEISYAFGIDKGELDFGYWDSNLTWHSGEINPFGWMIEDIVTRINERSKIS